MWQISSQLFSDMDSLFIYWLPTFFLLMCVSRVAARSQGAVCRWPRPLQLLWGVLSLQEVQVKGGQVYTVAQSVLMMLMSSCPMGIVKDFKLRFTVSATPVAKCKNAAFISVKDLFMHYFIILAKANQQQFRKCNWNWILLCRRTLFRGSSILSHPVGEGAPAFGYKKSSNRTGKNAAVLFI